MVLGARLFARAVTRIAANRVNTRFDAICGGVLRNIDRAGLAAGVAQGSHDREGVISGAVCGRRPCCVGCKAQGLGLGARGKLFSARPQPLNSFP